MCTPVAVLSSIQLILRIASHRGSDKWYGLTPEFILRTITETPPELHPTGLLSKALLFNTRTAEELGTIYEVGSMLLQQCYGKWASTNFRLGLVSAALDIFPDASFNSVTDLRWLATENRKRSIFGYTLPAGSNLPGLMAPITPERRSSELLTYLDTCCAGIRNRKTSILSPFTSHQVVIQERRADYYAWRILCSS